MNGLPVMPIPAIAPSAASFSTWSMAAFRFASDCGPKVVGLVWSRPLSSVMRANLPAPAGEVEVAHVRLRDDLVREQLGRALQKLSGGAHLLPPSKFGFSQMTVAPMPKPTHMVVRP